MGDSGARQKEVTVLSRERAPIRSRESRVTLSAWRMELQLAGGERAAITLVDPWYRGEGALLGSTQQRLAELWRSLLPQGGEEPAPPQYG